MKTKAILLTLAAGLAVAGLATGQGFVPGAQAKAGPFTRLKDGKPNFQGTWQAGTFAPAYDVEDHPQAQFEIPAGKGVIVDPPDGKIPYQDWANKKRNDLLRNHMYQDPEAHCNEAGVPRQMYAPFGYQIFQPEGYVVMFFEAFHAYRIIKMDNSPHLPAGIKLFEGDSRGHWEGDTLVVDVTNQNDKTWFDMAGNFHSDKIHVVERFTPVDSNTIRYEAKIEDPEVYTRPFTMRFDIVRMPGPNFEMMEFACVEGERDLQHYVSSEGGKAPIAK